MCKRLLSLFLLSASALFLAGCQTSAADAALVPVTRTLELPFPYVSWEQDANELLLFNERDLTVMLYDVETEKRRELPILGMQKDSRLVRSTSKNQFAFTRDNNVFIYDMRENVEFPFVEGLMPTFSEDDNKLAFWAHNGELLVVDRTDEWTFEYIDGALWWQKPCCTSWRPDGDELMYFLLNPDDVRQIKLVNTITKEVRILIQGDFISAASWSPDGEFIVFRNGIFDTLNATIYDPDLACEVARIPMDHVAPISWSPDGESIVVKRNELAIQLIDIDATLGEPLADYAARVCQ